MRYIRYLVLAAIALALIVLGYANRDPVTLNLLPETLAAYMPVSEGLTLPLFVVILGSVVAGLVLGFVWEWLREHKHRSEAARRKAEAERLAREVDSLKSAREKQRDDVLAILE